MKSSYRSFAVVLLAAIIASGCVSVRQLQEEKIQQAGRAVALHELPIVVPPGTKIDTIIADAQKKTLMVGLSREFSYEPYRADNVRQIYDAFHAYFGKSFADYTLSVQTLNRPIEQLIPNYFRKDSSEYDWTRLPKKNPQRPQPVVRNTSRQVAPTAGLQNRNIGLWHSHGWYSNKSEDRWEWQRPRLFESVEDLGPMTFTLPYLIPMLENAGANVFVPRERDVQVHEVVVDNDGQSAAYFEKSSSPRFEWTTGKEQGFAYGIPPYSGTLNPFLQGTTRTTTSDTVASASVRWIPTIPETGCYGVYVSYARSEGNVPDARYTVSHAGGTTEFLVNQQIGGGTWEYLGSFKFMQGIHPDSGKVLLTNRSSYAGHTVSADAVRFGGGMGLIARNGSTSGRPKYVEGARYYLQYAGMPDSIVYSLSLGTNDYKDDYQSRPEYINYLCGAPNGPNKNRMAKGLGIPIDISLAFHTDAGISSGDTTIGTLSIYSIEGADSAAVFPDSVSRLANRDLADLIQTQIVSDIRARYDPLWNRRQLKNADYSEATRPNVPGALLELLSHQNFLDMKFMLDPRFRFDVSRAVYKAMLRFLSTQQGGRYTVQPLPVTHFVSELLPDGRVALRWRPASDPLEPTATPDRYVVYTRIDDGGFDNGHAVSDTSLMVDNLKPGRLYSFKVTAANSGGESRPSEILSAGWVKNGKPPVLIISGFDRICGPASISTPVFSGFLDNIDAGVPDGFAINFTGSQHDFDPSSPFRTNDAPGYGASSADHEGSIIAGNTFDFPALHGASLMACGMSFASCAREAVMERMIDISRYNMIDLILGKEKETHWQRPLMDSLHGIAFKAFPPRLQNALREYCQAGGNIFVSGAYIGTDLFTGARVDSSDMRFAATVLKYTWVAGHAARTGRVAATRLSFVPDTLHFSFNTELSGMVYAVESPDAIGPAGGSKTVLRYSENLFSAATAYKERYGVIAFGFPFETILDFRARNIVMRGVLKYFGI